MSIKRRKELPDDTVVTAEYAEDSEKEARHPFLAGLRLDVYRFVSRNPNVTRRDVAKGLDLPNNVATARIKELIDEGFLWEPPGMRKENPSGVRARVLCVTDRKQGGRHLDKVRVEVELTIDCYGNYGVRAHVVDGFMQADNKHTIKKQRFTITAPHPETYKSSMQDDIVTSVSRHEIQATAGDIIEATAVEIDEG